MAAKKFLNVVVPSGLTRLQIAQANFVAAARSDKNITLRPPTKATKDGGDKYLTAPFPLKRMFGSPVVQYVAKTEFSTGPGTGPGTLRERQVTSGWGAPRGSAEGPGAAKTRKHSGLDYSGPVGDLIIAAARGVVTFVGFHQSDDLKRRLRAAKADVDKQRHVDYIYYDKDLLGLRNRDGELVAHRGGTGAAGPGGDKGDIGFGGMYVRIKHANDDFAGYSTEYMHLSAALVKEGQWVEEGAAIGRMGRSGGGSFTGFFGRGTHLHFNIKRTSDNVAVNPTFIIPNYWSGYEDSTMLTDPALTRGIPVITDFNPQSNAERIALMEAANLLQTTDRATLMQNQGGSYFKQGQADYHNNAAGSFAAQQDQTWGLLATLGGKGLFVHQPMMFDFTTGLWTRGAAVESKPAATATTDSPPDAGATNEED